MIPAQQVPPQKGQKNSSLVANLYTCTTVGLSLNVPLRLSQLNVYQLDLALDAPRQKLPARWLQQSRVNASTKPIMRIARPLAVLHNSSCFSSSSLSWLLRISYRCLLRRLSTLVAYFRWGFLGCVDRQVNVPFDLGTVQAANPHSP